MIRSFAFNNLRSFSGIKHGIKYSTFSPAPKITLEHINKQAVDAEYAVRGKIPIRADELNSLIEEGHDLPFKKIISANIGNPQQLDQKPLTWYRQVLSILQYPQILETEESRSIFPSDVIARASAILDSCGSIGAYSSSQGIPMIRKSVAKYIQDRDGYPSDPNNIFLTGGASSAVQYLLQILSCDENSGFLIPIPQYPLYTATITLNDSVAVGYYLDEENNWSTDPKQIRKLVEEKKKEGVHIKALVVINPGNPTGAVLSEEDIVELINITAEHGFVLIADEVYQKNIFEGEFISIKRVLSRLLESNYEQYKNVQLVSLHSTSKGVSGECGQRGGYMELVGFSPEIEEVIFKLASINLCSVVSGQALVELMINPPKKGEASYEIYEKETKRIHDDLYERAMFLYKAFHEMEDVTCNKPMGAMYLFPKLNFTPDRYPKLFKYATESGMKIDEVYSIKLLESTGICCVPGSGFGQKKDTYHLRTTFLAPGVDWIEQWATFHSKFLEEYKG